MVEKTVMFEESVRIPFLMRIPRITNQQTLINRRVSQIDIVPTLLDLMGKKIPASLEGKSIVPLLTGKNIPEDYVFIEWNPSNYQEAPYKGALKISSEEIKHSMLASTRTVIAPDGWKLCLRDKDHSQLFNLAEDPLETSNLYYDPANKGMIEFLTQKINEWQEETKDVIEVTRWPGDHVTG
jgi:arylsulfatase A-like enzyme